MADPTRERTEQASEHVDPMDDEVTADIADVEHIGAGEE